MWSSISFELKRRIGEIGKSERPIVSTAAGAAFDADRRRARGDAGGNALSAEAAHRENLGGSRLRTPVNNFE